MDDSKNTPESLGAIGAYMANTPPGMWPVARWSLKLPEYMRAVILDVIQNRKSSRNDDNNFIGGMFIGFMAAVSMVNFVLNKARECGKSDDEALRMALLGAIDVESVLPHLVGLADATDLRAKIIFEADPRVFDRRVSKEEKRRDKV